MNKTTLFSRCAITLGLATACVGAALAAPDAPPVATSETAPGFEVRWEGKMMRVHRDGDASPRVELTKLADRPGTFAIGPLAGLRGEITALDGVAYIAHIVEGKPVVENDWKRQAPFLVYGYVTAWKEVPLPPSVQTPKDLETLLPEAAREAGLNPAAPFPFKLQVPSGQFDYHIINNTEEGYQVSRPHQELMARFKIHDRPAKVLGVYSTEHAGVFTHHGETTHIHVISDDGKDAGHLDAATFGEGAMLYLPVP